MSTTTSTKRFVSLIDPAYKAGMLQIPIEKTFDTKGRNDWLKGALRKDLSLCCLFQRGRCHAEERCHQVHVDKVYMESLRAQQAKIISCCAKCNDTASLAPAALNFFATHFGGATKVAVAAIDGSDALNEIAPDRVAYTIGLVSFMETARPKAAGQVVLPGKKACRLHLRGACKYGKDCKNIHLCSKLTESILAGNNAPSAAAKATATPAKTPSPASSSFPSLAPATTKVQQQPRQGIANRAAQACTPPPAPVAPVAVAETPKPLPSFSLFSRPNVAVESDARGSLHLSCSQGQLDAIDVNENSGRLSGIIFDPKKALEDSHRTGAMRFDFNSTDALWLGATSPGQKRRGSNASSNGTTASCDRSASLTATEWNPLMPANATAATGGDLQQQMDFLRIFS